MCYYEILKRDFPDGVNNTGEDPMASLKDRIIRAARLDVNLYEEVEADKGALGQAMVVVVLSSIAAGIGSIERAWFSGILIGTITALIGWFFWAYLTYFIGWVIQALIFAVLFAMVGGFKGSSVTF
jgi:hypothetical protein